MIDPGFAEFKPTVRARLHSWSSPDFDPTTNWFGLEVAKTNDRLDAFLLTFATQPIPSYQLRAIAAIEQATREADRATGLTPEMMKRSTTRLFAPGPRKSFERKAMLSSYLMDERDIARLQIFALMHSEYEAVPGTIIPQGLLSEIARRYNIIRASEINRVLRAARAIPRPVPPEMKGYGARKPEEYRAGLPRRPWAQPHHGFPDQGEVRMELLCFDEVADLPDDPTTWESLGRAWKNRTSD